MNVLYLLNICVYIFFVVVIIFRGCVSRSRIIASSFAFIVIFMNSVLLLYVIVLLFVNCCMSFMLCFCVFCVLIKCLIVLEMFNMMVCCVVLLSVVS